MPTLIMTITALTTPNPSLLTPTIPTLTPTTSAPILTLSTQTTMPTLIATMPATTLTMLAPTQTTPISLSKNLTNSFALWFKVILVVESKKKLLDELLHYYI